jgi:hypothetical protein
MAACNSGGSGPITTHGNSGGGGSSASLMNPVPDASADPQSGSRLKPNYRVGDDGSKEYVPGSWWDTQRSETCSFATASDGKDRCLPDGAAVSAYSDSNCTAGIAALKTGCAAPKYGVTATQDSCHEGSVGLSIYSIGATTQVTTLYVLSGTSCLAAGPAPSGFDFYTIGSEVPANSFLAADTKHD